MKKLTYLSGVTMKKLTYLGVLIISTIILLFAVEASAQEDKSPMVAPVPFEIYCGEYQELKDWLNSNGEVIVFEGQTGHKLVKNATVYFFVKPESGEFTYVVKNPANSQACIVDIGVLKMADNGPKVES